MESRSHDQMIGKILFKSFRVKRKLGEGSFGKVYTAIDLKTKEEYAVKIVSKIFTLNLTI